MCSEWLAPPPFPFPISFQYPKQKHSNTVYFNRAVWKNVLVASARFIFSFVYTKLGGYLSFPALY